MKTVMVTGFFDGFTSAHLDYLEQASKLGEVICIVASDIQAIYKKRKVNIPEKDRLWIVDTMLRGIGCNHLTVINAWDKKNKYITETLKQWKPDILFRGYDKTLETMPVEERKVCEELGIEIIHAKNRIGERHSSEIFGCL